MRRRTRFASRPVTASTPPLAALAPLLAEEPALRAVIARQPTVAVPDSARSLFVASLAGVTSRRPLLLAVPTGAEAERLVRDLGQFLGDGEVELFPAWETLPFERVSPSFETMGRRLRVMWRLRAASREAARRPRSWWRRCARWCSASARTPKRSSRSW